jgi:hypothetical protein
LIGHKATKADLQPANPYTASQHTTQEIVNGPVDLGI